MPHGGARQGAGRKPYPPGKKKRQMSIKLDPILARYLDSTACKIDTIEAALTGSAGYRAWRKRQSEGGAA